MKSSHMSILHDTATLTRTVWASTPCCPKQIGDIPVFTPSTLTFTSEHSYIIKFMFCVRATTLMLTESILLGAPGWLAQSVKHRLQLRS